MLQISLNRLICSTHSSGFSIKQVKKRLHKTIQTTQPLFCSNLLSSDSQPTSASGIRWIGYGCKNARSSSSVRHSWSCLNYLWDSQSNTNPITVQCKEGTRCLLRWSWSSVTGGSLDERQEWQFVAFISCELARYVFLYFIFAWSYAIFSVRMHACKGEEL